MKSKRFTRLYAVIVILIAIGALVSGTLFAAGEMDMLNPLKLPGKWWKRTAIVKKLNLTPEQIDKIDSIFMNYKRGLIDLKAQMEKNLLDFQDMIDQPEINRDAVLQKLDEISSIRAKIVKATVLMGLDIREVLTPEQIEKIKNIRAKFRERMYRERLRKRLEKRNR